MEARLRNPADDLRCKSVLLLDAANPVLVHLGPKGTRFCSECLSDQTAKSTSLDKFCLPPNVAINLRPAQFARSPRSAPYILEQGYEFFI